MKDNMYNVYKTNIYESGYNLKLDTSLFLAINNQNVISKIEQILSDGNVEDKLLTLQKKEKEAFDRVSQSCDEWTSIAKEVALVKAAKEYLDAPEATNTNNCWIYEKNVDTEYQSISNYVYQMFFTIQENTVWNVVSKKSEPDYWTVSWSFCLNSQSEFKNVMIAGQNRKKYTDKDKAYTYVKGRKKAYSKYFTEAYPPIPKKYAEHFKKNGVLLPGYTIEEV